LILINYFTGRVDSSSCWLFNWWLCYCWIFT